LRKEVLALTGENPDAPGQSEDAIYEGRPMTDEEVTAEIIEHAPGPLRVIACRYAGERGFTALRGVIARCADGEPSAFRWTLDKSLALLERGVDAT
jgi:hypothetical protein